MRNVIVVLIATLAASVALADGPTVAFKYVDRDGTVTFVDSEKRIPAAYRDNAVRVELGALSDYDRLTVQVVPSTVSERLEQLRASNAVASAPSKDEDCGSVRIRSERRDVKTNSGGTNARFFIAEDDCGVLFDAPYYPELNALRR